MSLGKRLGGLAKLVDPPLTMADLAAVIERSERRGFEMGLDAAERTARLPVNDCPMCELRAEVDRLREWKRVADHTPRGSQHRWGAS
jgi:hypothetical protein